MVQKHRISDYWSKKRTACTSGIQEIFSRGEFWSIKRNIKSEKEDKQILNLFYKVQNLLDEILCNTNKIYNLPKSLTLGESMIKFEGRSKYRFTCP